MDRRKFILQSGLAIGAAGLVSTSCTTKQAVSHSLSDWAGVRAQFPLNPAKIHMAQMFLASHPRPVAEEIQRLRDHFDAEPVEFFEQNLETAELHVREAAAKYMGVNQEEIALTDSTTMGLSLMYSGMKLKPGDHILTTTHDHYATEKALDYAAAKTGAKIQRISLYETPSAADSDQIASKLLHAITSSTRVVGLTWVHSSTGVKLPIKRLAKLIAGLNADRPENKRIYFAVDGVHGFGVDDVNISDLGCDFFVAGTHKWIFGPRGTGVFYARKEAASFLAPIIPAFSFGGYGTWAGWIPADTPVNFADTFSPGGFHSFEYRWALGKAFDFHMEVGKTRIWQRTRDLSARLKDGLKEMKNIKLHTPIYPDLSAGINCFEVDGIAPADVLKKFAAANIVASTTPYKVVYARLTPSVINTEAEVDQCLKVLQGMAV
jgi:selenocysteine lyase/cysteine desulfurase